MENQIFIDSVLMSEIIQPGRRSINEQPLFHRAPGRQAFFAKTSRRLRRAALSFQSRDQQRARLLQVKNAEQPTALQSVRGVVCRRVIPSALMKRFGQAMGLTDEAFNNELMILSASPIRRRLFAACFSALWRRPAPARW